MDKNIFMFFYNISNKSIFIRKLSILVAKYSYHIVFILYILYFFNFTFLRKISFVKLVIYILVPFLALKFNTFLRNVIKRKRPFVAIEDIRAFIPHSKSYSCPSNHSTSSAVICLTICILGGSKVIMILPIITGLSRVMTGVHYPSDVFIGWIIGGIFSLIFFL